MISSIKKILSRYSIRYPRSLIYMLQASEYDVSDFLDWYKKTDNFNNIEKRKKLVKTSKSLGLLLIAWTMLIFIYAIGLYFLITTKGADRYLAIFIIIFAPYILPYLLSVKLFFLRLLVQKPVEYFLLKNTKKKLEKHKGIKIAVVGSYGKTTMREVLKTVLSAGKKVSAPPHSYNTPLGINKFVKNLKNDEDVLIFEFGEYYPGDIEKLSNIVKPNIGIITGINEAHLKKFKNIETTISTIFEISDFVEAKNLYINGESKLAKENAPKESTIYSKEGVGNWKLEESETNLSGLRFTAKNSNKEIRVSSKLIGLHQLGPLGLSIYLADRLGLSKDEIKKGIGNTKPFEHRLQPKDMGNITLIDDSYNGNPDGVKVAIEFLSSLKGKRRFYLTPGLVEMGPKKEEVHIEIGKQLAQSKIEKVILIKNSATPYIEEGLKDNNFKGDLIWFDSGPKAHNSIDALTVEGDVVLIQNDWPDQYN